MKHRLFKICLTVGLMCGFSSMGLLVGCASSKPSAKPAAPKAVPAEAFRWVMEESQTPATDGRQDEEWSQMFSSVYFDFDSYVIREDQKSTLMGHVERLKFRSDTRLLIEGHCDERGTVEYNLALAQKRADSVQRFLVASGVDAGRLKTVSYGEERPAVMGHTEEAWAQNRRAGFVVMKNEVAGVENDVEFVK